MNAAIRKLHDTLDTAVSRAAFVLKRELATRMRSGGYAVTPEEFSLLEVIEPELGTAQSELVQHTFKDKTTVTRLVDGLVRKGLIERGSDPHDRRIVLLRLTEAGRALLDEVHPLATELLLQAQSGLSDEDLETTIRTLNLVLENCRC